MSPAGATLFKDHPDRVEHQRTGLLEILTLGLGLGKFGPVRIHPALASILVDSVEPKRAHDRLCTAGIDRARYRFRYPARLRLTIALAASGSSATLVIRLSVR